MHAADEDAKTAITLDNGAIIQAYNDISSFRTEGAYTKPDAPSNYAGYIFAGWYSDENGEKPLSETAANQASSAYAKFVPKEVLSIKAQVSSNLINPDTSDDGIGAIRFVTTVDSKHYKEVGFIFDIEGGAQDYKVSNNFVYTELFAVDPITGIKGEAEKLTPEKTFSATSKYFKTCTFYNIPEEQYGVNIKATPFWVTLDGTTVKAELLETESTKTVEQGKIAGWAYVSADTAIASDDNPGTEAKPFATLNKALEKVQNGGVVCVMGNYGIQIWGGGNGKVKSENAKPGLTAKVGNTHVTITKNATNADIMSIYGGSYCGVNKNTSLVIEAGKFQQVFGGSQAASMEGNVDVQILGGTVTRRVYGGCYNDYPSKGENAYKWVTSHYVTGNISVTIGTGANITINSQTDNALVGGSRRESKAAEETSIIIVKDYNNNSNLSKVGKSSFFSAIRDNAYNFLVKATAGGNVLVENGALRIVPDAGYKATVTYGSDSQEFTEAGTYTLPANAPVKSEITVTFTENSAN